MFPFVIEKNHFLQNDVLAYYHHDYIRYGNAGNPDFIAHLKNDFGDTNEKILRAAQEKIKYILMEDLYRIEAEHPSIIFTICVVPRSKAECNYIHNQLLFKDTIDDFIQGHQFARGSPKDYSFHNGVENIKRHTDTRTTHLNKSGYGGDGDMPYPGITKATCHISNNIQGKNILLIDDIYTKTINVIEDCIQALYDNGATSVVFYAVGKTR